MRLGLLSIAGLSIALTLWYLWPQVPEVTAPKYIAPSPTAPDLTIEPVQNPVSVVEPENTQWGSPDGKDNTAQVAPVSYSIEEYQRDIPQEGEGDIESTADNPKQEAFDFPVYDIDIALWHKDPDAKSTFENFQVPNDLDSRNFIRFDESALSAGCRATHNIARAWRAIHAGDRP